jgi:hypothetical protein
MDADIHDVSDVELDGPDGCRRKAKATKQGPGKRGGQGRSYFRILTVTMGVSTAFAVLTCGGLIFWIGQALQVPARFREVVNNPAGDFTEVTGLPWPNTAKLVAVGDTHGGFHGDGELYLVFDVDQETVAKWLTATSPWDSGKWQRGPVPTEIGIQCGFGQQSPVSLKDQMGREEYLGGSAEIRSLLAARENWHVARSRGPKDMPWHNGNLLVIDLSRSRVWLSSWDF